MKFPGADYLNVRWLLILSLLPLLLSGHKPSAVRSVRLSAWMCGRDAGNSITRTAKRLLPVCIGGKCYLPKKEGEPVGRFKARKDAR